MKRLMGAVALLLVWAPGAYAQPREPLDDTDAADLTAVPRELRAGESVTVSGSGCAPGNQVRFELYSPDLHSSADAVVGSDGTFVQSINLPSTTKVGRSWLRATCLTPESDQRVMDAVLLVSRPDFVITWTNIIFGLGAALVTAGIGLTMLRQPQGRRSSKGRSFKRGRRRGRKRRSSRPSSALPDTTVDGIPVGRSSGTELNGTKDAADRSLEVD